MSEDKERPWLSQRFLLIIAVTFICFYAVMYFSAVQFYNLGITPQGQEQANTTATQIDTLRQTTTWQSIFVNNFKVSIVLLLPAVGLISFMVVLFNTGQVLGLLAASNSINPFTYLVATAIPVGIIETMAYSVLSAEMTYVLALLLSDKSLGFERLQKHSWKSFLIYVGVLILGAVIEYFLIKGGA
jgi:hypothetical protein